MSDDLRDGLITFFVLILAIAGIVCFKMSSFNVESVPSTNAATHQRAKDYTYYIINKQNPNLKMYGKASFNKSKNRLVFISDNHKLPKQFKKLGRIELKSLKTQASDKNAKLRFKTE